MLPSLHGAITSQQQAAIYAAAYCHDLKTELFIRAYHQHARGCL